GVELEALDQLVAAPGVGATAQTCEQVDDLAAGQVGPQVHVTGHICQPLVQGDGVGPRIAAEHRSLSAVGLEQAEEHPDGGGLARAVGPEEAVDLPAADCQVQSVERAGLAESLRQPGRLDDVFHASDATLASQTCEVCRSSRKRKDPYRLLAAHFSR